MMQSSLSVDELSSSPVGATPSTSGGGKISGLNQKDNKSSACEDEALKEVWTDPHLLCETAEL